MIQIDEHIFQRGWFNHQPDYVTTKILDPMYDPWIRSHRGTSPICVSPWWKKTGKKTASFQTFPRQNRGKCCSYYQISAVFFRVEKNITSHEWPYTTPPKFNIKTWKWWIGRWCSFSFGVFSGSSRSSSGVFPVVLFRQGFELYTKCLLILHTGPIFGEGCKGVAMAQV